MNRFAEAVLAVSAWYLIVVAQAPFVAGCRCAFRVHAEAILRAFGFGFRFGFLRWHEAELDGPSVLVPGALYIRPLAPFVAASVPLLLGQAVAPPGA